MRNIIIVTFINSYNYGAFLQAKATLVLLSKLGFCARFLNYCNKEEEQQRKIFLFSNRYTFVYNIKRIIYKMWMGYYHRDILNGKKNFQTSINDLPKTKKYRNISEIESAEDIDIYICGSDQIWNPEICNGKIDPVYFAGLTKIRKRISFASSMGSYTPKNCEMDLLKKYLSSFDAISVRERFAQDILSVLKLDTIINVVLDPTLCLSSYEWHLLIEESPKTLHHLDEDYILLYFVTPRPKYQLIIDKIKEELNLKTVLVKNNNLKQLMVDSTVNNATPYDFVNMISNARFVLTDSFHGTAFSINFNREFLSIINEKNPERVRTLCIELGLEDRLISNTEEICKLKKINYSSVNMKLEKLRKSSVAWLKNAMAL